MWKSFVELGISIETAEMKKDCPGSSEFFNFKLFDIRSPNFYEKLPASIELYSVKSRSLSAYYLSYLWNSYFY